MWVYPSAPVAVDSTEAVVFQCQKSADFPFSDTLSTDSIFKYFSMGEGISTQYAGLKVTIQSGDTGSDWTTVKTFSREFGKDTLQKYNGQMAGIEGTFTVPVSSQDYYRVKMVTSGTDSTTYFQIVAGLSNDHYYRDTPTATA